MKAKIFCLFFLIVLEFIVCPQNGWTQDNTIPMIGAYYFDGWSGKNNSQELWAQEAPTHLTEKYIMIITNVNQFGGGEMMI